MPGGRYSEGKTWSTRVFGFLMARSFNRFQPLLGSGVSGVCRPLTATPPILRRRKKGKAGVDFGYGACEPARRRMTRPVLPRFR